MQDFSKIIEEQIRRGQEATGVMSTPVVVEFFERKVREYVSALLDPSTEMDEIAVAVGRFRCMQELHDFMTQAVRDGLTAAERIAQQAKGDFR